MTRLILRRGIVASIESSGAAVRLVVDVGGEQRSAVAYTALTGPVEPGDEVVVNTAALDLGLGSGGFDVVHANLTRGLDAPLDREAHVMKLNYTSLQHAVEPLEAAGGDLEEWLGAPVAVIALHGQLPCVAWAAARGAAGQGRPMRVGYVQGPGGALPGDLSDTVRALREAGLLVGHVTAGQAFGGEHEAITVPGALHAGVADLGWDAAIVGPGPGILGSDSPLGHGGMAALDAAHAALAVGCPTVLVPRMSSSDPRERHRGLSHHTSTVLRLLLRRVLVALPPGAGDVELDGHRPVEGVADTDGYAASGLPTRTMGRSMAEDPLFFSSALAGGSVLAEVVADGL